MTWGRLLRNRQARFLVTLAATILLTASGPVFAQSQQSNPTATRIIAGTNLVEVPVIVRDKKGVFVPDLNASDFLVTDEGKAQTIKLFKLVSMPELMGPRGGISAPPESRTAPPRTKSGSEPIIGGELQVEPLRIVILFPPLGFESRHYAIRASERFVRREQAPFEEVAIVEGSHVVLPFTSDSQECLAALEAMGHRFPQSERHSALWPMAAASLLESLVSVPGRKALVIFTDFDVPTDLSLPSVLGWLVSRALEANVAIYPVDARGLVVDIPFGSASTDLAAYFGLLPGDPHLPSPSEVAGAVGDATMGRLSALSWSQGILESAARDTGGRAVVNYNDLSKAFDFVHEDASHYYLIGYYLPSLAEDGRFHRIRVRVNRPNLSVAAKQGYFARVPVRYARNPEEAMQNLNEALMTDRPFRDIQVDAHIGLFPTRDKKTFAVPITCELRWGTAKEPANSPQHAVALVGAVWNADSGRQIGGFRSTRRWMPWKWRDVYGGYQKVARYNLLVFLHPGNYVFRLAGADLESGVVGNGRFQFEVDNPPSGPFAMSSIILADQRVPVTREISDGSAISKQGGSRLSARGAANDPLLLGNSLIVDNPLRVFRSDEELILFARVYPQQGKGRSFDDDWTVTAALKDRSGKVIAGPLPARIEDNKDMANGIAIIQTFNLGKLSIRPGTYAAEIQFIETGNEKSLSYSALFSVDTQEHVNTEDPRESYEGPPLQ